MAATAEKSVLELAREHDERVARFSRRTRGSGRRGWPMKSIALACQRDQVAEFNEFAKKNGITGVHYHADGTCEISDAGQRNKLLRARGLFDRDGNHSPRNF